MASNSKKKKKKTDYGLVEVIRDGVRRRKTNQLFEPNSYQFSENLLRTQYPSISQNLAIAAIDVNSSISTPLTPAAAEEENSHPSPPQKWSGCPIDDAVIVNHRDHLVAADGFVSKSKSEKKELRHKLVLKLERVRSLLRKLEMWSLQLFADDVGASLSNQMASVIWEEQNGDGEVMVKQRMIPKPYQYYKSSEPKKMNRIKHGRQSAGKKPYAQAFRKCGVLLSKLMKNKYGWVFNSPVDTVALGLPDYHFVIKHPMDLGTIRHRLSENLYTNPFEFSGDVRLTFGNAMV
ncbi:hypothetical protein HPP92_023318 [Vanilla planifolia]|uniref:Bromo domain-containing protein n=1 Tax=Vanilla planifolia TaxID=51239 RepID=A0A835PTK9_VANPL|nr:hypothetical protein HPP92_023318 [Vanilla planifolia]